MNAESPAHTRAWAEQGTALILDTVTRFDNAAFDSPSILPGWSRRHVLAHLAANAEALHRLTRWAATGEPSPMYASAEQRAADIERGAGLEPVRLREWLAEACTVLTDGMDALSPEAWRNPVSTAQGATVAATAIPWMRTREVWIHAVDLDAEVGFEDFPADLLAELVADVAATCSARRRARRVELRSTDSADVWHIAGADAAVTVSGSRVDLARWLTGRGARGLSTSEGELPELGAWL